MKTYLYKQNGLIYVVGDIQTVSDDVCKSVKPDSLAIYQDGAVSYITNRSDFKFFVAVELRYCGFFKQPQMSETYMYKGDIRRMLRHDDVREYAISLANNGEYITVEEPKFDEALFVLKIDGLKSEVVKCPEPNGEWLKVVDDRLKVPKEEKFDRFAGDDDFSIGGYKD